MSTGVLALVIAVSVTAGLVAAPRLPGHGRPAALTMSRLLVWVLAPFIYLFVIARLHVSSRLVLGLGLGYLELAMVGTAAWLLGTRVLRLPRPVAGSLVVCVILANTGYLGLPLVASLLGRHVLGEATVWDGVISGPVFLLVAMPLGALLGDREDAGGRAALTALVRNPPLLAVVVGLVMPNAWAPDVLLDAAHVVVYVTVPIAFALVGISLRDDAVADAPLIPSPLQAPVLTALGLRLVAAPLLMLGLSAVVLRVPHAYLLQAAMPCGANSLIVAHVHGLDVRLPAAAVLWSTILVLVVATTASFVT